MSQTIFFSWQADTPTRIGRNFLKGVLEEICGEMRGDTSLDQAVREAEVDSDTMGVAGQPAIADTIFKKIDGSAIFVADMTFAGTRLDGRPTPNPNVLIEYGWALKCLGSQRVICVMNDAYGEPSASALPFDLAHLRWPMRFTLSETTTAAEKKVTREKLVSTLGSAIRACLKAIPTAPTSAPRAFPAVEPRNGPTRFRAMGESLGFQDDFPGYGEEKEIFLKDGPSAWLRVMPVLDGGHEIGLSEIKKNMIGNSSFLLTPIAKGGSGFSFVRAGDGAGICRGGGRAEGDTVGVNNVAFAFESGEVWSVDCAWFEYNPNLFPFIEPEFANCLRNYGLFLNAVGVPGPYRWIGGLTGTRGRSFNYPAPPGYSTIGPGPKCATDLIEAEGVYDGKESPTKALLPLFRKVFSKCGLERPAHLLSE